MTNNVKMAFQKRYRLTFYHHGDQPCGSYFSLPASAKGKWHLDNPRLRRDPLHQKQKKGQNKLQGFNSS